MKIRAYNCLFGDCYCIYNADDNPLYVDFGIHKRCSSSDDGHNKQYNSIIKDINNLKCKDFLLSHYHEDHYSGFVKMMKDSKNHKTFNTVYLPFIPLEEGQTEEALLIIKTILMNGILRFKHDIKGLEKQSFIKLLDSVYKATDTIVFLKKGDKVNNKYTILWPEVDTVVNDINKSKTLKKDSSEYFEKDLNGISRGLFDIIRTGSRNDNTYKLDRLQKEYISFASNIIYKIKTYVSKTNNISNEHCIVFHNERDEGGNNILFTGDMGKKTIWNKIEHDLHDSYSVVKIPHHGTTRYYHDFTNRAKKDSYILIPNGGISYWKICNMYADSLSNNAIMVCNEGCFCTKNGGNVKCPCKRTIFVKSLGHIDICSHI